MVSLQQGPTGMCVGWTWKQIRTSPNTSAPLPGPGLVHALPRHLHGGFHCVNEKQTEKKKQQGSVCFLFVFPSTVFQNSSVCPFSIPSSPPSVVASQDLPSKLVTSFSAPPGLKSWRLRVWPHQRCVAWSDGGAVGSWLLQLLWLRSLQFPGGTSSYSRC